MGTCADCHEAQHTGQRYDGRRIGKRDVADQKKHGKNDREINNIFLWNNITKREQTGSSDGLLWEPYAPMGTKRTT